jgi:hypothetical protein
VGISISSKAGSLVVVLSVALSCTKEPTEADQIPECSKDCPAGTRRTTFEAVVRGQGASVKEAYCETHCEAITPCLAPNIPAIARDKYSCQPLEGFSGIPKDGDVDLSFVTLWDIDRVTPTVPGEAPKICQNGKLDRRTGKEGELLTGYTETDVDCGGEDCPACSPGSRCASPLDCLGYDSCATAGADCTSCDGKVCGGFPAPVPVAAVTGKVEALFPLDTSGDLLAESLYVFTSEPPALTELLYEDVVGNWTLPGGTKLLSFASILEPDGATKVRWIAAGSGDAKVIVSRLDPAMTEHAQIDVGGPINALLVSNFISNATADAHPDLVVAYSAGGLGLLLSSPDGTYAPPVRYAEGQIFDHVIRNPGGIVAAGSGGLLITRGTSDGPLAELFPLTTEPVSALRGSLFGADVVVGMRDVPEIRGYSHPITPDKDPALMFARPVNAAPVTAVEAMRLGPTDDDFAVVVAAADRVSVVHQANTDVFYRYEAGSASAPVRSIAAVVQNGNTATTEGIEALAMNAGGTLLIARRVEK